MMSFTDVGLIEEILRAVQEKGYTKPTPIQEKAIPCILEGNDLMASAQTGTGKTAGFTLPLLQKLMTRKKSSKQYLARALILTPTRELAAQIADNVRTYGKYLPLRSTVIFGGVSIQPQIKNLRKGVDIIIATPGRLLDHVMQKTVDLSNIEILVLDEADRMLDMGFIRDIRKIIELLPENRQNLLFSATFSQEVKNLASTFLRSPKTIETSSQHIPAPLVSQVIHPVDHQKKKALLSFLISSQNWNQVLVFTGTKHGASRLSEQLAASGISSVAIHGNKSQAARARALGDFKKKLFRVLVATDIAARGLDIDELPHVINFDLPFVPEDYVHRIGRTGRAGNEGKAISLVSAHERQLLFSIERLLKQQIPQEVVPGYEPTPSSKGTEPGGGPSRRRGGAPRFGNKRPSNSNRRFHSAR